MNPVRSTSTDTGHERIEYFAYYWIFGPVVESRLINAMGVLERTILDVVGRFVVIFCKVFRKLVIYREGEVPIRLMSYRICRAI